MANARRSLASGRWWFVAALVATVAGPGCGPGKLPCDRPEWASICAADAGTGGPSDAGGPGADTPPAFTPTAVTEVKNCARFTTVGGADAYFKMRCAPGMSGCHLAMYDRQWQDFESPGVWERLTKDPMNQNQARRSASACVGGRVADTSNWENSVLRAKIKSPVVCPPTGSGLGGFSMPPGQLMPKMDPLEPDEVACIEGFLKALAGAPQ
jgi:hypothetical protein